MSRSSMLGESGPLDVVPASTSRAGANSQTYRWNQSLPYTPETISSDRQAGMAQWSPMFSTVLHNLSLSHSPIMENAILYLQEGECLLLVDAEQLKTPVSCYSFFVQWTSGESNTTSVAGISVVRSRLFHASFCCYMSFYVLFCSHPCKTRH